MRGQHNVFGFWPGKIVNCVEQYGNDIQHVVVIIVKEDNFVRRQKLCALAYQFLRFHLEGRSYQVIIGHSKLSPITMVIDNDESVESILTNSLEFYQSCGNGYYHAQGASLPTLLSIFPLLFIRIALALDLRLIFSASGKRTAMMVRAPCSGF